MNTMYKTDYKPIPSPFQQIRPARNTMNIRSDGHPVQKEIQKMCETYQFTAEFAEDTETLSYFPHISGLVAIKCTLKRDGQVVAFGRSCAVFSRLNKYVERTISTAINGSFLSAANNACKVFDVLRTLDTEKQITQKFAEPQYEESDQATDKQKSLLESLVAKKVSSSSEREHWLEQINGNLSKFDASELISSLLMVQK